MNYSNIVSMLNQASAFDLFRLRAAIDRILDQPNWMQAVQARLHIGTLIEYFEPQENRACKGTLLEFRRKHAVVLDLETQKKWLVSYAAINLGGADTTIREQPKRGLGRHSVSVGEVVGFVDRHHLQRTGKVIRLNDKTVTLQVGAQQWRVAYSLLHKVVDSVCHEENVSGLLQEKQD